MFKKNTDTEKAELVVQSSGVRSKSTGMDDGFSGSQVDRIPVTCRSGFCMKAVSDRREVW